MFSIKIALQNRLDVELNRDIYETAVDTINYIENFLVNYSFKTGKFENQIIPCDIRSLVEKKIENYKHIFISKGIHIDVVLEGKEFVVNSIMPFLSSIVGNVISNIALHARYNSLAVINISKKKDTIFADFKNYFDETESDFSFGLDFCAKLASSINASIKFSKSKDCAIVNLKIPNFRN